MAHEKHAALTRRRSGLVQLLEWLASQPGQSWQQRWLASGADADGQRGVVAAAAAAGMRPLDPRCGVSMSSNLRVSALVLVCADVIRPSLDWLLTPRTPQNLVAIMTTTRDPDGLTELTALCDASTAGRTMKTAALRRAATIMATKGGTLRDVTVGDCLELSLAVDGRSIRKNRGIGLLPVAPHDGRLRAASALDDQGVRHPGTAQPGTTDRPVRHRAAASIRDLLVDYLRERQPTLDHTSMQKPGVQPRCRCSGATWNVHHPGIDSLRLTRRGRSGWKQRVDDQDPARSRPPTDSPSRPANPEQRRAAHPGHGPSLLPRHRPVGHRRPGPVGPLGRALPDPRDDLAAARRRSAHRKSRMDQRTRERLPVLPVLVAHPQRRPHAAPTGCTQRGPSHAGAPFTAGGQTLRRTRTATHATPAGSGPRTPTPANVATSPGGTPGVLDLGRGRSAAPHRHPDRGTHRTLATTA